MLRIAICDDEAAMIETVRAITAHFLRTQGVDGEIQCYSRSDTLRDDLDDGSFYDLFLLDIEMPKVDGMTLAEKIHAELPAATMIFITSHLEYAISAYEFAIFRYIPKTQLAEKLPQALADFYKLYALERGGRTAQVRKSLSEVAGELGPSFLLADRGAIINLANVDSMDGQDVILDGARVCISKASVPAFKTALLHFWEGQL